MSSCGKVICGRMIWIILIPLASGFLLDKPLAVGNQTTATGQYLTVSEFTDEKKLLHFETEKLRHDMEGMFALLTAQIQQKLSEFENKIPQGCNNCTNQKNENLKQTNFSLEQKIYELGKSYYAHRNETKMNFEYLKTKFINLKQEYQDLQEKYNLLENSLKLVENNTKIDISVLKTKQLETIKPLQEIYTLQQAVQSVTTQTQSLTLEDQSRRREFLALFNLTLNSRNELSLLKSYTNSIMLKLEQNQTDGLKGLEQEFKTLQQQLLQDRDNQKQVLNYLVQKFKEAQESDNRTFDQLQKQIDSKDERVALTSYPSTTGNKQGILKFDNVKFSYGIHDISTFKTTGKFVCEKEGIYLIAVSIMTSQSSSYFHIYRNADLLSTTYIGDHDQIWAHTGSTVVVVRLNVNDELYISAPVGFLIHAGVTSKFVFVKIN